MGTTHVFIDGGHGTTGLEIAQRLEGRERLNLIAIDPARRKDPQARREALNDADVVLLCLPDDAAREAVALIDNPRTRIIDASTAHRTAPDWAFGFPEFRSGQYDVLRSAMRISNPGCYSTGFLALVAPLTAAGLLPVTHPHICHAVSGYSGGGKAMIAAFEQSDAPDATSTAWRSYATRLAHKHVGEMRVQAGLIHDPLFTPSVARTLRGMVVEVPLQTAAAGLPNADTLRAALAEHYQGCAVVSVASPERCAATELVTIEHCAGSDRLELFVFGNATQTRLVAVLDNLGKGAAGAAVQTLNLIAGLGETAGLRL